MAVNASSVAAADDDSTTVGFSDVYDYAGTSDIVAELKLIPESESILIIRKDSRKL